MLEGHHFQNAYVTRDIDRALATFRDRLGARGDLASFEIEQELWTPNGTGTARQKLAFVWVGDMQFELIEPVSGPVEVYADALPEGDGLAFHHVCFRVDDWDAFRAKVTREGWRVVIEGASGDALRFLYIDARDTLGHYVEYLWCTPDRWAGITAGMRA